MCNLTSNSCSLNWLAVPAVILLLGACVKPPQLSMITEYMDMGSLFYLIHLSGQKNKLSWRRRIKMLRDICRLVETFLIHLCSLLKYAVPAISLLLRLA